MQTFWIPLELCCLFSYLFSLVFSSLISNIFNVFFNSCKECMIIVKVFVLAFMLSCCCLFRFIFLTHSNLNHVTRLNSFLNTLFLWRTKAALFSKGLKYKGSSIDLPLTKTENYSDSHPSLVPEYMLFVLRSLVWVISCRNCYELELLK